MTSGTSGKPKAIVCPHAAYAHAAAARQARHPYAAGGGYGGEREGVNVMFAWEALRPLCYGQTAVVIPDDVVIDTPRLVEFIADRRLTRLLTTPSLLSTLLETAAADADAGAAPPLAARLPELALWLLCGEVVPTALARAAAAALPHAALVNDYSSWEGSDVAYATLRDPAAPDPPPHAALPAERFAPVGTPAAGAAFVLLEPAEEGEDDIGGRRVVPHGAAGELFVRSPMMFTGYMRAPALTAQRLLPVPPELRAPLGLADGSPALVAARARAAAARRRAAEETEEAEGGGGGGGAAHVPDGRPGASAAERRAAGARPRRLDRQDPRLQGGARLRRGGRRRAARRRARRRRRAPRPADVAADRARRPRSPGRDGGGGGGGRRARRARRAARRRTP